MNPPSLNQIAQTILQDHRRQGHRVYLVTSSKQGEEVFETAHELAEVLIRLYEGKVFLFAPEESQDEEVPPVDRVRSEFLKKVKTEYDLVLAAVPDLLEEGTALPLLHDADAAVMVVKARRTPLAQVRQCKERLESAGVPLVCGVLTNTVTVLPRWVARWLPEAWT